MSLRPDVLISCIKAVTKEFPHLIVDTMQENYEYGMNIFDITQGKEPELENLPF